MSKFLDAVNGVNVGCPPVFMMRQAGRYHSHYRKIKEKHTFEEICKNPKIAAEVALAPVEAFGFDAGILFSDILFILETIGYDVVFNPGPQISKSEKKSIDAMNFQFDAIVETKKLFGNTPIIGFVGGLATVHYFLKKSCNFRKEHEKIEDFIAEIHNLYLQNIILQINAGANCIAIFDSKTIEMDEKYWKIVQNVVNEVKKNAKIPIIYYSETQNHLNLQNVECFGITSQFDIPKLLNANSGKAFYGNFDEKLLTNTPEICKKTIDAYLQNVLTSTTKESRQHWISSLGHGVLKESFEENVAYFVQAVREIFS